MKRSSILLFFCLLALANFSMAQEIALPLGYQVKTQYQSISNSFFLSSVYPQSIALAQFDSVYAQGKVVPNELRAKNWTTRKGTIESVVQIKKDDVVLRIDPMFYLQAGSDLRDESLRADTTIFYTNTRAARVQGWLGTKFYFLTEFYENQSFYPQYADAFSRQLAPQSFRNGAYFPDSTSFGLIPGMGRAKKFQSTGFDYGVSNAFIAYSVNKDLSLQVGTSKNFIGEGYRTLFLSDNAFNYPFIKAKWSLFNGKVFYNYILATFINLQRIPATTSSEAQFKRKDANFHYVEIMLSSKLKLGLYEANQFNRFNDRMGSSPFNYALLNPIIFSSSLLDKQGGRMASNAGADIRFTPNSKLKFYGQVLTNNRFKGFGAQLLVEVNNLIKGLSIKAEYSQANKYLYSDKNEYLNFVHYNQPIANPLGNQFSEVVCSINYNRPRFGLLQRFNFQQVNVPIGSVSSATALNMVYSNRTRQAENTFYSLSEVWYNLTFSTHFQLFGGYLYRNSTNSINQNTSWLMFGFRSNINNQYFDF